LRRSALAAGAAVGVLFCMPPAAQAQTFERPSGYVSVFADYFPNRGDTTELRGRIFAEQKLSATDKVHFTFSGFAEALEGRRPSTSTGRRERVTDAVVRLQEATTGVRLGAFDFYAGYGRVVWGRLDEFQPTDVINPLDVSRFFFEGRSEARLPVAVIRGRLFLTGDSSIEAVYVPVFRRGRFDQLEEPTSPFNIVVFDPRDLAVCLAIDCTALRLRQVRAEPPASFDNAQGGIRFNATSARVDWSLSAYRGYEPFGTYRIASGTPVPPDPFPSVFLEEAFPRFTMVGGDFETVAGQWGLRGEIAAFVDDNFQSLSPVFSTVRGSSIDAGAGVDRKAGNYRMSGTVIFHRERYDRPLSAEDDSLARSDVSLVLSADRTFGRDRYRVRAFSVYNPSEGSGFARAIASAKLQNDLALEVSGGWFAGEGRDLVGRFKDSDFTYARVTYYF
jgi:hypothetical protein